MAKGQPTRTISRAIAIRAPMRGSEQAGTAYARFVSGWDPRGPKRCARSRNRGATMKATRQGLRLAPCSCATRSPMRERKIAQIPQENTCRSHQWSAGSWPWFGCGRYPRPPGRAHIRDDRGFRNVRSAVSEHTLQGNAVLLIEQDHPVVEQIGGGERGLSVIKLGEADWRRCRRRSAGRRVRRP